MARTDKRLNGWMQEFRVVRIVPACVPPEEWRFTRPAGTTNRHWNYEKAVQLEPGAADIHVALADLYVATGALARAEQEYETAIRLDPANGGYRVKQARKW